MPIERKQAVINTRDFLLFLLDRKQFTYKKVKISDLRKRAYRLLKHYPASHDIAYNIDFKEFETLWHGIIG